MPFVNRYGITDYLETALMSYPSVILGKIQQLR